MKIEDAKQYEYEEERIDFTTRQHEVAERLATKSHNSIADDLGVTKSTVDTHASNINEIVAEYPELVTVMLRNLNILEKDAEFRRIVRAVEDAAVDFEEIEVNVEY